MSDLREEVREKYAAAARVVPEGAAANDAGDVSGCYPEEGLGVRLYNLAERTSLPGEAVLASLGCGNPTAVAELREGETVLDLGWVAASMCFCRPSASGTRERPTAWT